MSALYIDEKLIEEFNKQQSSDNAVTKEAFEKYVQDYIDTHFKSEDSVAMYALFNPTQRQVLQDYFKGFSVEMYRELNGTVALQIEQRKEKTKEKINNLMDAVGISKLNLEDWVYDGMVDTGKNNGAKCDLCPRPVRYAHFAVNKTSHECLKFGCNCAADFFNIDKASITSLRTIQAQTLRDIKLIACIMENKQIVQYYKYMCGYLGNILLESGEDGVRDLATFKVKWDSSKQLVGDVAKDAYPVLFGTNRVATKSLRWIKENIVSCLNADLDDNIYEKLDNRDVVYLKLKDMDKVQANNEVYVKYALIFIQAGVPIPLSLAKKINSIISKVTRQHHPDYIKFSQELLISHNLAKSSLLKTAFTDFMVNYLASSVGACERDNELVMWNIRGQLTFYRVVLLWEQMMTKLIASKDLKTMINKGLITEEEFDYHLKRSVYNSKISYTIIKPYIEKCIKLFISNKEVLRKPENLDSGFSKYMLKGVDEKINIDLEKLNGGKTAKGFNEKFTPDVIPYNVAIYFHMMEDAYKQIINVSILSVNKLLSRLQYLETDEDIVKYLCSQVYNKNGVEHQILDASPVRYNDSDGVRKFLDTISVADSDLCKGILKKYKKEIKTFKKDALNLYNVLKELSMHLRRALDTTKITTTNINDDYENLFLKKEKTNKEYFEDYCELLVGKRGNKAIQACVGVKNLKALTIFKDLSPYSDMLLEIQNYYVDKVKDIENKKFYTDFKLDLLSGASKKLSEFDLDTFKLYISYEIAKSSGYFNPGYKTYDTLNMLVTKEKEDVQKKLKDATPSFFVEECSSKYADILEKFYIAVKNLPNHIKEGITMYDFYSDIVNRDETLLKRVKNHELSSLAFKENLFSKHSSDICYRQYDFSYVSYMVALAYYQSYTDIVSEVMKISDIMLNEYKVKKDIEYANSLKEIENKKNEEKSNKVMQYLNEHIRFFEITNSEIEDYYKNNPQSLGKKSESSIRRKLAFSTIHYENAYEMLPRFVNILTNEVKMKNGTLSNAANEAINKVNSNSNIPFDDAKTYAAILRTECYNHSLIFNHLTPCYNLLKLLATMDLKTVSDSDLLILENLLKNYFILLSEVKVIDNVLRKYGINSNLVSEIAALSIPPQLDVKSVLDKNVIDESGLSGVDKAKIILNDPKFGSLHKTVQSIINYVVKYNSCTPNQNNSVNKAYEKLGYVPKGTYTSQNIVDNATNSTSTSQPTDMKKEGFEKIRLLKNHPDYNTKVSDHLKSIIKTMETRDMCTSSQLYSLNKGLEALGIKI